MKVPCCRTCRNFYEASPSTREKFSSVGRCSEWEFAFYVDTIQERPETGPDIFMCGHHQDWEAFREIAAEVDLDEDPGQGTLDDTKLYESVLTPHFIERLINLEKRVSAIDAGYAHVAIEHETRLNAIAKRLGPEGGAA